MLIDMRRASIYLMLTIRLGYKLTTRKMHTQLLVLVIVQNAHYQIQLQYMTEAPLMAHHLKIVLHVQSQNQWINQVMITLHQRLIPQSHHYQLHCLTEAILTAHNQRIVLYVQPMDKPGCDSLSTPITSKVFSVNRSSLSDLLNIPVANKPKKKVNTGRACVLTSIECLKALQEKENLKAKEKV